MNKQTFEEYCDNLAQFYKEIKITGTWAEDNFSYLKKQIARNIGDIKRRALKEIAELKERIEIANKAVNDAYNFKFTSEGSCNES